MKIGLFFGSFNPVHIGHLIIANFIVQTDYVNQVWLVPSPQNPLKKQEFLLNEYHRQFLIQIAIDGEKNIKCSNVEFSLPRPSFTIDTLIYLKEKYPFYTFSIIMGSDSLQNIKKWKNYEVLIEDYQIIVYKRPGFALEKSYLENVVILDAPLIEISSTNIRKMIKNGNSIRFFVPDVVKDEIEKSNYYK